ncbi:MAG: hypothetical protein AB1529_02215 [Candidatus Micrarchaeota archaeon]
MVKRITGPPRETDTPEKPGRPPRRELDAMKPEGDRAGKASPGWPIPMRKTVEARQAIAELCRTLGAEPGFDIYVALAFPPKVRLSRFEGGLELCDTKSSRQRPRMEGETLGDISQWVKYWYLSLHEEGGKIIARFIDRAHPDGLRLKELEMAVRDPGNPSCSMERFADRIRTGR